MIGSSVSNHKSKRLRRLVALLVIVCVTLAALTVMETAVSGDDDHNIEKYAVRRVQPSYPPNAQKYKIEGTVTIQVTVGNDGKVSTAEFVRGNNVFRSVSLDAAKRWEFKLPTSENNQGVIHFTFKFSE